MIRRHTVHWRPLSLACHPSSLPARALGYRVTAPSPHDAEEQVILPWGSLSVTPLALMSPIPFQTSDRLSPLPPGSHQPSQKFPRRTRRVDR